MRRFWRAGLVAVPALVGWLASCGGQAPEATGRPPLPVTSLRGRSPLAVQGAVVLQYHQCLRCHSFAGAGGGEGPALDGVASRLDRAGLARRIAEVAAHRPAPDPARVTALVAFLSGDRDPGKAGAQAQ